MLALPPPQAANVIPAQSNRTNESTAATERSLSLRCLIMLTNINKIKNRSTGPKLIVCGDPVLGNSGRMSEGAVVVTVTVTGVALVPFSVTELGETLHVESEGAPVQLKETVWLKPPPGETETE
jgi:hypothetical protein